jgi:hypothetical protein
MVVVLVDLHKDVARFWQFHYDRRSYDRDGVAEVYVGQNVTTLARKDRWKVTREVEGNV